MYYIMLIAVFFVLCYVIAFAQATLWKGSKSPFAPFTMLFSACVVFIAHYHGVL